MRFLGWLSDWWNYDPPSDLETIDDPVFGELYVNDTDDEHGYLWAKNNFQFLPNLKVDYLSVPGDENGASAHAREMYLQLKERYSTLTKQIVSELFTLSDSRFNQKHNIASAEEYCRMARLHEIIISEPGGEIDLELGYRLPQDPEHTYMVSWKDWRKIGDIHADG